MSRSALVPESHQYPAHHSTTILPSAAQAVAHGHSHLLETIQACVATHATHLDLSLPQSVRGHAATPHTASLNTRSSSSTDSLVSALSSFPATPDDFDSILTPTHNFYNHLPHIASCSPSTDGSDHTYVPCSPTLGSSTPSSPPSSSAGSPCDHLASQAHRFELDPLLVPTSPFYAHIHRPRFQRPPPANVLPVDLDASRTDDMHAFDAIFSCLSLNPNRSSHVHIPPTPSYHRLHSLMHDFEATLSRFRCSAQVLVQELDIQLDMRRSKLDQLLMSSVRRSATQALEAMIMVSWFRDTKMNAAQLPAQKPDTPISHAHPQQQHQSSTPFSQAAPLPQAAPRELGAATGLKHTTNHRLVTAHNQLPATVENAGDESRPRLGFEAHSRDPPVWSVDRAHDETSTNRMNHANHITPFLSIEDIARARSSTPLHFNRPASPFEPSHRHWLAHRHADIATRVHTGSHVETRCTSFSNAAPKPVSKLESTCVCRVASPSVANASHPSLVGPSQLAECPTLSGMQGLVTFPRTMPSPPISPSDSAVCEHTHTTRQPKQSLKSLRNFKLSLRSPHNDPPLAQNTAVDNPRPSWAQPEKQPTLALCPRFEPSHQASVAKRNVSNPMNSNRAMLFVSKRPLSLAYTRNRTKPNTAAHVARLTGIVRPLTQLHRSNEAQHIGHGNGGKIESSIDISHEGETQNQGGHKLSLRSLLRVFSGLTTILGSRFSPSAAPYSILTTSLQASVSASGSASSASPWRSFGLAGSLAWTSARVVDGFCGSTIRMPMFGSLKMPTDCGTSLAKLARRLRWCGSM